MRPAVGCGVDEREPDAPPPDAGTALPARLGTMLVVRPCTVGCLVGRAMRRCGACPSFGGISAAMKSRVDVF